MITTGAKALNKDFNKQIGAAWSQKAECDWFWLKHKMWQTLRDYPYQTQSQGYPDHGVRRVSLPGHQTKRWLPVESNRQNLAHRCSSGPKLLSYSVVAGSLVQMDVGILYPLLAERISLWKLVEVLECTHELDEWNDILCTSLLRDISSDHDCVCKLESGEAGIDIRRTEILQLPPMPMPLMSIAVLLAVAAEAVDVAVDIVIPCISMIDCWLENLWSTELRECRVNQVKTANKVVQNI